MNHRNSIFKRAVAFLLSLLMTVTSVNLGSLTGLTGSAGDTVTAYAAETAEPTGKDIVKAAMKYLGYGYSQSARDGKYNATGTFDCSSLVNQVLKDVGISGSIPTYTGAWLDNLRNRTLSLKGKNGKTIEVYYATNYADYKKLLDAHKDQQCAVVIDRPDNTLTISKFAIH